MNFKYSAYDALDVAKFLSGYQDWKMISCTFAENGFLIHGQCDNDPESDKNFIVSLDELRKFAEKYQADTNQCWDCKGTGEVFKSWDYKDGTKMKPCPRCEGNGKAY